MMAPADPERRGQLLVAAAAVVWSTAGPVQRAVARHGTDTGGGARRRRDDRAHGLPRRYAAGARTLAAFRSVGRRGPRRRGRIRDRLVLLHPGARPHERGARAAVPGHLALSRRAVRVDLDARARTHRAPGSRWARRSPAWRSWSAARSAPAAVCTATSLSPGHVARVRGRARDHAPSPRDLDDAGDSARHGDLASRDGAVRSTPASSRPATSRCWRRSAPGRSPSG